MMLTGYGNKNPTVRTRWDCSNWQLRAGTWRYIPREPSAQLADGLVLSLANQACTRAKTALATEACVLRLASNVLVVMVALL